MEKRICFITGTRAEYGILAPIMRLVAQESRLQIIATNMHLSPEYGLTYKEIEADGFGIDAKVEMLLSSDTPVGTVKSMGVEAIGLADALDRLRPDVVVILGDRYEVLVAASSALVFGIPTVHLHGGETTLGAYDNAIRHAITQMSALHLTSTEEYRRRIIAMGKDEATVHCIGSPAADTLSGFVPMPKDELERQIGFVLGDRYVVATFHPATLEHGDEERQTKAFLDALDSLPEDVKILLTLPNSDTGGRTVRMLTEEWTAARPEKAKAVASLGAKRYFSAVAGSLAVVGNSSSGLIEAPSLHVPTLGIGSRQAGRARGASVVNAGSSADEIKAGLARVLSPEMQELARTAPNPYYRPGTVRNAARLILDFKV